MFDLDALVPQKFDDFLRLPLKDSEIDYYPNFFEETRAEFYFHELYAKTAWQQDDIKVFGKTYKQPRLTALYGKSEKTYTYSGITMHPKPFTKLHLDILKAIRTVCDESFTSVLLNLYRDGKDSNGWHSDNEKELGLNPIIASVSLGAARPFHLKHKKDTRLRYKLSLKSGSLLLMKGETQHYWLHQLPKSKRIFDSRINLTFRKIS